MHLDVKFFADYIEKEKASGEEAVHIYGATYQRPRLVDALRRCFRRGSGDAIEIGCMAGGTSKLLAEVCADYGRTLVCVDPWKNMDDYKWIDFAAHYPLFLEAIKPYADHVKVIRLESQKPVTIQRIQEREYAFAFVDGDHSQEGARVDLQTVLPVTKYAVASDDHRYDTRVQEAHRQIVGEFKDWQFQSFEDFREAWFTK